MKSLVLMLVAMIGSQSSAVNLKASTKVLDKVLKPMLTKIKRTIEADQINRITQVLTNKYNTDVSMLLRFETDRGLEILNIGGTNVDAALIAYQDDASKELAKKLVDSGSSGVVLRKEGRRVYVSSFEAKSGDIIFAYDAQEIKLTNGHYFKDVNSVTKQQSYSVAADSATAGAVSESTEAPDDISTLTGFLAHTQKGLSNLQGDEVRKIQEESIKTAKERIAIRTSDEAASFPKRMIESFANEEILWQEIYAYVKGRQSSAARLKTMLTQNEISGLDEILDGRLTQHLEGTAVLTDNDFRQLCRHSTVCPWLTEGGELAIEQMLAIERLAFDHRKFITAVGDIDYLKPFNKSDLDAYGIISDADMVYRGEKIQLLEYDLPKLEEVKETATTSSIANNAANQRVTAEELDRVRAMLDSADHINYTGTFIDKLKSLDNEEFAKVKAKLDKLQSGNLDGEKIDDIFVIKWPVSDEEQLKIDRGKVGKKLRMYYGMVDGETYLLDISTIARHTNASSASNHQKEVINNAKSVFTTILSEAS
ncbi:MAG: hypothetical protein OYH77_01585 [Pseudomonadota bacterium]|nr:hypothetical protein [Pseudomonadota bacterium]